MSKPHSKTVRGTLDNPKTKQAIKADQKPSSLGDPTSLKPENDDMPLPPNDSAPPGDEGSNKDSATSGELPQSKNASNTTGTGETSPFLAPTPSNPSGELPHTKKAQGAISNSGSKNGKSKL
jgi:hypothetical protein